MSVKAKIQICRCSCSINVAVADSYVANCLKLIADINQLCRCLSVYTSILVSAFFSERIRFAPGR